MKKTLFMCALGLTVATSMVAGTMAVYTHSDELIGTVETARAKHFYVGVNTDASANVNLKLAPGQSADWDFSMTNVDPTTNVTSETATDVKIAISGGTISNWNDFAIQLIAADGSVLGTGKNVNGNVEMTLEQFYQAGVAKAEDYKLRFIWLDGNDGSLSDEADTDLVWNKNDTDADYPDAAGIKVTVTGVQSAADTPEIINN